jgi:stage II sporulation protein D
MHRLFSIMRVFAVRWMWGLLVLAAYLSPVRAQEPFNPLVRVWLTRWQNLPLQITVETGGRASSKFAIYDIPAGETASVERDGTRLALRVADRSAQAEEWVIESEAPLAIADAQGNNRRAYRGKLMLRLRHGRLQVLNILPLEDYLRGVVPLEMPPSFPLDALKAQAIAARSWTVRNRHKHERDGADVCDSNHCQVYGGASAERESTTAAVQATTGMILLQGDLSVDGVYTADCGGQPGVGNNATAPPPDRDGSGRDYCVDNPQHYWSLGFTFSEVWRAAGGKESGQEPPNGEVDVQVMQTDGSGRATRLRLRRGDAVQEVSGVQLRRRLALPSTLFRVRLEQGTTVVFEGSGSGHGSGLCQWGAAGRARAGHSMEDILQAYYPGARMAPLSEVIWEWRRARKNSSVR